MAGGRKLSAVLHQKNPTWTCRWHPHASSPRAVLRPKRKNCMKYACLCSSREVQSDTLNQLLTRNIAERSRNYVQKKLHKPRRQQIQLDRYHQNTSQKTGSTKAGAQAIHLHVRLSALSCFSIESSLYLFASVLDSPNCDSASGVQVST